jgi:chemotaxis signal transduction protein
VPLDGVVEVIPRVAIRPLPGAPAGVSGVIDHRGTVAVVIDLRERFGERAPIGAWDPFVVLEGTPRHALVLDGIDGLEERTLAESEALGVPIARAAGLTMYEGRSALVLRPAELLDPAEHEALRAALASLDARERSA